MYDSGYLFAKGTKCICVRNLWNRFTDAMNLIGYGVKSASRNVTNAFGKITSVV